MSGHVFVVSEWLPKEGYDQELWRHFKRLMALSLEKESGCVRAHVTRQISHPGSPSKSKYTIVLLQLQIGSAGYLAKTNSGLLQHNLR